MTTAKKIEEPLIDALEAALRLELLALKKAQGKNSEDPMTLTDKMKVYDRVLKLVAIKAKMADDDAGSFFREEAE